MITLAKMNCFSSPLRCTRLLVSALPILSLLLQPASGTIAAYLPISYTIPFGQEECLYELITKPDEHLTASVFVLSGEELRSAIVFEGPVAPVDLTLTTDTNSGKKLKSFISMYDKQGTKMFVNGKYGESMLNVKPVRIAEMIDFEEEEEDFYDDYEMSEEEIEDFNKHHDLEHQRMDKPPPPDHPPKVHDRNQRNKKTQHSEDEPDEEGNYRDRGYDDDFRDARDQMRQEHIKRQMDMEAEYDDDFVKLQVHNEKKDGGEHNEKKDGGDGPHRRNINDAPNHRRLSEAHEPLKLLVGEPYQKTIMVESPGWYRLCVHPRSHTIEVEMELRKSSTYGPIDRRTGHVPSLEEVETHSDIHALYEKEDDAFVLAEEGAIQDEDLTATKTQLRILERVYSEIITKQLEERRIWNWRTIKNQHIHSHLVLGNLVETVVYMVITGWQVYTIRKWFRGEPTLGR